MANLSVIIPAAGSGVRMDSRTPKPFIKIGGKSILEHTISKFVGADGFSQLIVASSKEWFSEIESLFGRLNMDQVKLQITEGGKERQFSIYNALQKVSAEAELVAVHDAVRPFITKKQIDECSEVALKAGGAVLGVPAKDTIKNVDSELSIEATPDRSRLWQAQTPQIFQKELLIKAYESAIEDNFIGTDDASLVERIGGKVQMVEGERENLKITYPIDLKIAELILGGKS